jgi:hypothetical protein
MFSKAQKWAKAKHEHFGMDYRRTDRGLAREGFRSG